MIRKSKGKYKWKRKATYSVDWSLSPVIHSYLVQLKSQLIQAKESGGSYGVPVHYCDLQAKAEGHEKYYYDVDIDLDSAHNLRMKDLDELIWAFDPKSEPDIKDYDFTYDFTVDSVKCSNEAERNRYREDSEVWWERKQKALKLFGEIYLDALQW